MVPGDLDEVHRIERAAHVHPWSAELIRRELDHAWSRAMVAVAPDGPAARIVGYVIFWLVHDELHILNVATDPVARRRGVGRRLMLEAEAQALANRASLATLEVRRSNAGAIALYEGLGYVQVGMRPRYYQPEGEDAFVLTKTLAPGP
jgi:ribosomal-protein-alanine N-acetyltransferase